MLLDRFRWVDGHADLWHVFRAPQALATVITALADPYRDAALSAVVGVESRGFLLGAAVAVELGVGFVAVRKPGSLFPGRKLRETTTTDYRGNTTELLLQADALQPGDRVVLVDDWIETGAQAAATARLVGAAGAELVGVSVIVDELDDAVRAELPVIRSLLTAAELPGEA